MPGTTAQRRGWFVLAAPCIAAAASWIGWNSEASADPPPRADQIALTRSAAGLPPTAKPMLASPPVPESGKKPTVNRPAKRDEHEWQGMLVEPSGQAVCGDADGCGLAMACIAGQCGPCTDDSQCAAGEACVLEHCLRSSLAACRTRADCGGDQLCALSGYSADTRGNGEMRAFCLASTGGKPDSEEKRTWTPIPGGHAPVETQDLLQSLDGPR